MSIQVVKVGGSLASQPKTLKALCLKLAESSKKHKFVLVPGGGEFADVVRKMGAIYSLSDTASHRMAILGMEQYGLLLHDLMPDTVVVDTIVEARGALEMGKLPVFFPSKLVFNEDSLENTWDVTSDSIALYVAARLGASKVVLVTDVDGVFTTDPKRNLDAVLITSLKAEKLLGFKARTSVDIFFPKLLMKAGIPCIVVNGLYPERVEAAIDGQPTVSTLICP
jgi:hypothetical protein